MKIIKNIIEKVCRNGHERVFLVGENNNQILTGHDTSSHEFRLSNTQTDDPVHEG